MTVSDAFSALGLTPESDFEAVKSEYRKRALATHPDQGGNSRDFIRVRAAYEILCTYYNNIKQDYDIHVPDDLKDLIKTIVREFQARYVGVEAETKEEVDKFHRNASAYIKGASRTELRNFSGLFQSKWNEFAFRLMSRHNRNARKIVNRYENWFAEDIQEIFNEQYKSMLRSYKRSPRFYVYGGLFFLVGLSVACLVPYSTSITGFLGRVCWAIAFLPLTPLAYYVDCRSRRPKKEAVPGMDLTLFNLDRSAVFVGSQQLEEGRKDTIVAGVAGLAIGDLFSKGIGIPLVGAAAGLLIGGVVDRFQNPTEKIRSMIFTQLASFLEAAEPAVVEHVVTAHQEVMQRLADRIVEDYEMKVRHSVKMLTES